MKLKIYEMINGDILFRTTRRWIDPSHIQRVTEVNGYVKDLLNRKLRSWGYEETVSYAGVSYNANLVRSFHARFRIDSVYYWTNEHTLERLIDNIFTQFARTHEPRWLSDEEWEDGRLEYEREMAELGQGYVKDEPADPILDWKEVGF